jgi:hypothetical protein
MTQTPFVDEEELKRLEAQYAEEEKALQEQAPEYTPQTAAQTAFQEPTAAQNQAAGNVQPVKSPQEQAVQQLTGAGKPEGRQPVNRGSGFIYGSGDPNATLGEDVGQYAQRTLEGLGAAGMGLIDFGMDAIGRIPGAEWIDDAWDKHTKYQNPAFDKARKAASIVLPSITVGGAAATAGKAVQAGAVLPSLAVGGAASTVGKTVQAGGLLRGLTTLGVAVAGDVGVNVISDQSEEETITTAVKEVAPWLPVPDALVTKDTDSPEVRRQRNIYESAGLSVVGDLIGYSWSAGRSIMDWFKPNDNTAKAYKASEAMVNADEATSVRISEINTQTEALKAQADQYSALIAQDPANAFQYSVDLDNLNKAIKSLENESVTLATEYLSTGKSSLTENPLDSFIQRQQISRDLQIDEVGKARLFDDPEGVTGIDAYITPNMFPEGSTAALSIPPGNMARNMADVTAIKLGGASGSPAPIMSERAYMDLAKGNLQSRDIILDIAEATRSAGDFDATVNGFRYTKAQMSKAAFEIYKDIIAADSTEDVAKLFLNNRDVKTILDGRKISYVNDIQAEGIAYAMRDLTDKYLGRVATETSARAMDTVGREISDISEGFKALPEAADYDRFTEMIADRIGFLMSEYSLNKYIAGWALKNQDRWAQMVQKSGDPEASLRELTQQFDLRMQDATKRGQSYRDMIIKVAQERPDAAQALIDAFAVTKGDVDTIDKLMKWSAQQLSPMGLLKGSSDGLNAFAQGVWAVRYNNTLSGISALRAITANEVSLLLRPINSIMGTGIGMMMGRNTVDDLQKAFYTHGSVLDVKRKALKDSWDTFKGLWNNGKWGNDFSMDAKSLARADLVTDYNPSVWDTLGNMEKVWEKEGNFGRLYQYRFARALYDLGNWRWFKYGTNALISADAYVQTNLASQLARSRAWEEVASIGYKGGELAEHMKKATKMAYDEMFDSAGNLTDQAARYATGEIALNFDDHTSSWLSMGVNKLPLIKPFFMFPKTGVNGAKMAMSYTPLATLPGTSRYAKVLWAGDDIDKIKAALLEHNIDYDLVPNGMEIFKGLEAEYRGRVAFGGLLASSMVGYAMGGNIRGNGPVNAAERRKLRDNFNWQPKTINIGGKWVSYAGYEPLDTVLTLVGDLAYYSRDIGSTLFEDYQSKLAWTFAATFVNKTWVAGLEPLVAFASGDQTAVSRFLANEVRSMIPLSGALGVAANAVSSSQKDIYNDFVGYVKNRIPGLNKELPEQIDIYTGKALNDIDNPILRGLNAINPVKISDGTEKWRQWIIDSGWDGVQMIRKDSTGNHEYTPAEREILYRYIGEQQVWKEFDKLSRNKKYNDQLDRIRAMRVEGRTQDEINAAKSEVYSVMNQIMVNAQKSAELRLQNENQPMWNAIQESIRNKNYMQQGRIDDAARAADRRKAQIEQLTQMYR